MWLRINNSHATDSVPECLIFLFKFHRRLWFKKKKKSSRQKNKRKRSRLRFFGGESGEKRLKQRRAAADRVRLLSVARAKRGPPLAGDNLCVHLLSLCARELDRKGGPEYWQASPIWTGGWGGSNILLVSRFWMWGSSSRSRSLVTSLRPAGFNDLRAAARRDAYCLCQAMIFDLIWFLKFSRGRFKA